METSSHHSLVIGFCRNGSFGLSWLNLGSLDFLLQSVPLFPFPAPIGSKTLVKLRSGCARAGGRCQRLAGNSTGWEMPPLYFLCSCLTKMNICIIFNEKRKKKKSHSEEEGLEGAPLLATCHDRTSPSCSSLGSTAGQPNTAPSK